MRGIISKVIRHLGSLKRRNTMIRQKAASDTERLTGRKPGSLSGVVAATGVDETLQRRRNRRNDEDEDPDTRRRRPGRRRAGTSSKVLGG